MRAIVLVLLMTFLLAAPNAAAGENEDAAQLLYEEAKADMHNNNFVAACPKLEKSLAIDEAMGARFLLAECYEKLGRLASAWSNYVRVADQAHREGQTERETFARDRATRLRARVPTVTLVIDPATKPLQLEVWQNGERVSSALVEAPIPLDPGTHAFEIRAPGHHPFSATVNVTGEATPYTLNVPALIRSDPNGAGSQSGVNAFLVAGLVVGGVGLVGMGVSVGIAASAKGSYDDALEQHCVELRCDPEGVAKTEDARSEGTAATVVFGVSAGVAAVGAVLAIIGLTSGGQDEGVAWRLAPYSAAPGVQLEGSF